MLIYLIHFFLNIFIFMLSQIEWLHRQILYPVHADEPLMTQNSFFSFCFNLITTKTTKRLIFYVTTTAYSSMTVTVALW